MSHLAPPSSTILTGWIIQSETQPDVGYEIIRLIAHGGMASAYFAHRHGTEGSSPVVVKVVHPRLAGGRLAPEHVAIKEAVALGRVGETVPPTPYVVRYVDSGSSLVVDGQRTAWTALEYVHGGIEGTTLEERVAYAAHYTGYAFDPVRAANALRCVASGLSAIHAASVLHRDLSPGNVLCCGLGDGEVCKISDFGVARSFGIDVTFQGLQIGTLGYSAPETDAPSAGPSSDVFSLGAIVYFMLTGRHLFDAPNPIRLMALLSAGRPSIRLQTTLSPEFAERPDVCARIDEVLAVATSLAPKDRYQSAEELTKKLLPILLEAQTSPHSSVRVVNAILTERFRQVVLLEPQWIEKSHPRPERFIRNAAWDSEGRALALTSEGVSFWDGNLWLDAQNLANELPAPIRSVERHEGGGWLILGGTGMLGVIDEAGGIDLLETPKSPLGYCFASGYIDDLVLAIRTVQVGPSTSGFWTSDTAELVFFLGRGAQSTAKVPAGLQINTLKRASDTTWLLGGRKSSGTGFAMLYEPIDDKFTELTTPEFRAFIGGGSCVEREHALLAGSNGVALRVLRHRAHTVELPGRPDLAAAAVDILGNEWVASPGALWHRSAEEVTFRQVWSNPAWSAPFISLMAEPGRILGMTCDGAVIEGLFRLQK